MKPIKMFGLAALAALMAMAFLGAGSAMAESTALCTEDLGTGVSSPCGSAAITSVHEVSVGKAKLLSSIEVQCNVLFSSTSVGAEAAPQIIKGHFTYTNCGCTVEEEAGTTSKIEVLREGHETASVTGAGKVKVNCFGIQCTYTGTGLKGTAKGPLLSTEANGEVNISEQVLSGSGVFCPSQGKLDIKTTPLVATYISGGLHYCIEVEHAGHGAFQNAACTTAGAGNFELVVGPNNLAVGAAVCNDQRRLNGLWKDSSCTSDDAANGSKYEKGIVKTVQ